MGGWLQRWMPVSAAIIPLVSVSLVFGAENVSADGPVIEPDRRVATASRTVFDCADILKKQSGGWCELAGASIADVFPGTLTPSRTRANRASAVIDAWNGAAWDPDRMILYFHGGSISDYGGGEVYSFALGTGQWRRLTGPVSEPAASTGAPCKDNALSPATAHTHDGFVFSRATDTIWLFPSFYSCTVDGSAVAKDFWEFNPSVEEQRNGLAPLAWRRHDAVRIRPRGTGFRTASGPGNDMFVGHSTAEFVFNPGGLSWRSLGRIENLGSGSSVYDPARRTVWSIRGDSLFATGEAAPTKKVSVLGPGLDSSSGMALAADGSLVFWNGGAQVMRYDPVTRDWLLFDGGAVSPPYYGVPVYSKWIAVPQLGVFVGYADYRRGVWVYRLPDLARGRNAATWPVQALLDVAEPGSIVTIPPGIYPAGATIRKPMTLRLKGVRILGETAGKSVLLVKNALGPVVIEDFTSIDPVRCGNCSGVKIEGVDFDVTIRRARISNAEMGILTDNRGGTLRVEDSVVEDIGHDRGNQPLHLIYAGVIDRLVVQRSILRRSHYLGHILKSRAKATEVRDSYLLGLGSRNSREADFPCGGMILFDRVVVHKGPNSDNADSFSMATEPQICAIHRRNSFVFQNGWIVFDRPDGILGTWHLEAPLKARFIRTRFVGPVSLKDFPLVEERNVRFGCRRAAGLAPGRLPAIDALTLK